MLHDCDIFLLSGTALSSDLVLGPHFLPVCLFVIGWCRIDRLHSEHVDEASKARADVNLAHTCCDHVYNRIVLSACFNVEDLPSRSSRFLWSMTPE